MSNPAEAKKRRTVGPYIVDRRIGSGSFADVYRGRHRDTGHRVAIKAVKREKLQLSKKHYENLLSEIEIMKTIDHRNVVKFLGKEESERHIYLVLEYCAGGDLSQLIRRIGRLSEAMALRFTKQLAAGLKYLRDRQLIHRDLKPQNLLLTKPSADADLKIADFGFARYVQLAEMADTLCGSPLYMAPEILRYQKYDAKVDLWSVGAILYEMVVGKPPFTGANHVELLRRIETQELRFPPLEPPLSPELHHLLARLLRRAPADRIGFDEFFAHPWLLQPLPEPDRKSVV